MEPYDVIVIGTGAGGSGVAIRCAKGGRNVAVVDDEPYGGTCMLRGCDPKKVFVSASELVDWHRRMTGQGVSGEGQLDWPALMRFKRTFTDPVPSRQETTYREL
ncbi:MAG: NAD(P)/FAD-dependent oxidoreductase, partial [Gemmatimonadetes bacterium]